MRFHFSRNFFNLLLAVLVLQLGCFSTLRAEEERRPNILFAFADDWGRLASIYGEVEKAGGLNDVVRTPNFDRLAKEGVLFRNAFVNAPSCTPCRSSLLSGQHFWRTGRGAILQGAVWDSSIPTWPRLLQQAGYHVGFTYKVWSPGEPRDAPIGGAPNGYHQAGSSFNGFSFRATQLVKQGKSTIAAKETLLAEVKGNFQAFLKKREKGQPYCYWFGPTNVHRKWVKGSGKDLWGINPDALQGKLPPFLPDVPAIRQDVADYMGEIAAFDAALGVLLEELKKAGERENTLVVVSGDHGPPGFPHGKCNLYDFGVGVALAIAGPGVAGGRVVDDFVSLPDLAPTFLEAAGLQPPQVMTAKSLWPVLTSDKEGWVDSQRTHVITGRERHVAAARAGHLPYPQRALRTKDFLFVLNFRPDRFPLGDPHRLDEGKTPGENELANNTFVTLPDEDAGPTKAWLVLHRQEEEVKPFFEHAYGKRPRRELFDLAKDPHQMQNVAADQEYAEIVEKMEAELLEELKRTGDPRLVNDGEYFETAPLAGPVKN